jgi:hypothetical protein
MKAFWDWIGSLATDIHAPGPHRDQLTRREGLLVPDSPGVPGVSRINTSLFPRSRYRANPTLRPPKPRLPTPPRLGQ